MQAHFWRRFCLERNSHVRIDYFGYDWRTCYVKHMKDVPMKRDRLVVLALPVGVSFLAGDGSDAFVVPHDSSTVNRTQATWSLDGRYLAWTKVSQKLSPSSSEAVRASFSIEILEVDTGRIRVYPVNHAPFFYYWHPDCTRLIYLCAKSGLIAAYVDLFSTPCFDPLNLDSTSTDDCVTDQTTVIYKSDAFYFCFSPIPGANRVLANIPASRTAILGFTPSMICLPLSFKQHRRDNHMPPNNPLIATPSNFQPPRFISSDEDVPMDSLLSFFTTPCWTSCNTMLVMVTLGKNMEALVAFDSAWDPKYRSDARPLSQVWRHEGIASVLTTMDGHTIDEDAKDGMFAVAPHGRIFTLLESNSSLHFVSSPSGRFVAVHDRSQLIIIELLYEEPWDMEGRTYFEVFEPKRLSGSRIVYQAPIITFALLFSPDGHTILYLTQDAAHYRWNTLNFRAREPKPVAYKPFHQMAYLVRHYIPFFSQYTQSIQFFSPDGTKFAYPADGRIWLQDVFKPREEEEFSQSCDDDDDGAGNGEENVDEEGMEHNDGPKDPTELCDGFFCSWSPR